MPIDVQAAMTFLADLSNEADIRVSVKESLKGGLIAGGATVIGGILLGPPGLAIGGVVGGCTASYMAQGKFKSAGEIIMEMDDGKRQILYNDFKRIVENVGVEDIMTLSALVAGDVFLQRQLREMVVSHLTNTMRMTVLD